MRRPIFFICSILLALTIVGMFQVKHKVQNLKKDLVEIQRQIAINKEAVHILEAEWAYLNEPSRIKALADRFLVTDFTKVAQVKEEEEVRSIYLAQFGGSEFVAVSPTLRPTLSSATVEVADDSGRRWWGFNR